MVLPSLHQPTHLLYIEFCAEWLVSIGRHQAIQALHRHFRMRTQLLDGHHQASRPLTYLTVTGLHLGIERVYLGL